MQVVMRLLAVQREMGNDGNNTETSLNLTFFLVEAGAAHVGGQQSRCRRARDKELGTSSYTYSRQLICELQRFTFHMKEMQKLPLFQNLLLVLL